MKNEKAVGYLKNSIIEKANKYKDSLGIVYNKLVIASDLMDFNELLELNDLSLLIDYFDYLNAVKQHKKSSYSVEQSCDKSINFTLISTIDGEMSLDTSSILDDKKEAQENIIFKENSYNGALIFEDEEDDDNLMLDSLTEDLDFDKKLWDEQEDISIDDLTDLLNDTSSLSENKNSSINSFGIDMDALEKELESFSNLDLKSESNDFFSDFNDNFNDDFDSTSDETFNDDELELLDNLKHEEFEKVDNESIENNETIEDDKDDDPKFESYYQSELEKKWGMFKINLPGWTLEDLDTMPLASIATLIRNDKIGLPDDLTSLTDDMVDFLMQQQILNERPEKLIESTEVQDEQELFLSDSLQPISEEQEELEKRLFEDKSASDSIEKADYFRKMFLSKGKKSLEVDNTEYFEQEKIEEENEKEIIKELSLDEMQTENDILKGDNTELLNDFDEAFDNISF